MAMQGITDQRARTLALVADHPARDIPFADGWKPRFGVPATVENDCNMIAVALRARDPERYGDNFVALLLSNGIGMGLVMRGELFTGTHSSGGEFGHMIHRPRRRAVPLRPARLHRGLCGQLRDLRATRSATATYAAPAADIDDADHARSGRCRARP